MICLFVICKCMIDNNAKLSNGNEINILLIFENINK